MTDDFGWGYPPGMLESELDDREELDDYGDDESNDDLVDETETWE